jgi:hypothetical protein
LRSPFFLPKSAELQVLFSRGILQDPGFAETLLSTYVEGVEGEEQERQLEMVTVNVAGHPIGLSG